MVHGTLIARPHINRGYKCTSTVPTINNMIKIRYSRGTLLFSTSKGIEPNVPSTTFLNTMELFSYCQKTNISLVLPHSDIPEKEVELTIPDKPEFWNTGELEEYFSENIVNLWTKKSGELRDPLKLDRCTTITNPGLFISSHLSTIKAHNGNPVYRPYFDRLVSFRNKIENMKH